MKTWMKTRVTTDATNLWVLHGYLVFRIGGTALKSLPKKAFSNTLSRQHRCTKCHVDYLSRRLSTAGIDFCSENNDRAGILASEKR